MHEAILYKLIGNPEQKKVQCLACKQACTIMPNHTGLCGIRQNRDGKLYLLAYGKASAVNIDPVEKKPLYHFLPNTPIFSLGTVGCNFGCEFCQNWDLSQSSRDLRLRLLKEKKPELSDVEVGKFGYELMPEKIIEICSENSIPSIAYTYNEPVIFFEYLYDTSMLAHAKGIKNVFVSNGYESHEALEKIHPYLDAINIDLKAFTDRFYQKLCKARLEPVLDTIKEAHKLGIWLEVTTLVIPGQNDSPDELRQIAQFLAGINKDIPWHVTAFHPDYKMEDIEATGHGKLIEAHGIGREEGLNYVYVGNIHDEKRGSTYCPNCRALLIERNGWQVKIKNFNNGKCLKCKLSIPGVWN